MTLALIKVLKRCITLNLSFFVKCITKWQPCGSFFQLPLASTPSLPSLPGFLTMSIFLPLGEDHVPRPCKGKG